MYVTAAHSVITAVINADINNNDRKSAQFAVHLSGNMRTAITSEWSNEASKNE